MRAYMLAVLAAVVLFPVSCLANPFLTDQDSKELETASVQGSGPKEDGAVRRMNGSGPSKADVVRPGVSGKDDDEEEEMTFIGQYNNVLMFRTSTGAKIIQISNDPPARIGEVKIQEGSGDMFFKYQSADKHITKDEVDGFYKVTGQRLNVVDWTDRADPCPRKLAYKISEYGGGLWWICADVTVVADPESDMPLPAIDVQRIERAKELERVRQEQRLASALAEAQSMEREMVEMLRRDEAMVANGNGPSMVPVEAMSGVDQAAMVVMGQMSMVADAVNYYRFRAKKWPENLDAMVKSGITDLGSLPVLPTELDGMAGYALDVETYTQFGDPNTPDATIVLAGVPEELCDAVDRHSGRGDGSFRTTVDNVSDIDIQCVGKDRDGVGKPTSYDIVRRVETRQ